MGPYRLRVCVYIGDCRNGTLCALTLNIGSHIRGFRVLSFTLIWAGVEGNEKGDINISSDKYVMNIKKISMWIY